MHLDEAVVALEKANADLEPELMSVPDLKDRLRVIERVERLAAFHKAAIAAQLDDADEIASVSGTSTAKAKATVETAKALKEAPVVREAFAGGDISLDQATEIAKAEVAAPGSGTVLLETASTESFRVLRDKARKVVLEAEQKRGLGVRQREARSSRSHIDELGMVNVHLRFEPHVGTPIVNRAEAEANRRFKAAKKDGKQEPFERHLADAYAAVFSGSSVKPHSSRPELVILVSHEVAQRGWTDVRDGEVCKLPGVGPVDPKVVKDLAGDAFLTGLLYDGKDLRR